MNVLIFVMTMMMILAMMTYAKLDAFRGSRAFQTVFEDYMQNGERGVINARAEKVYGTVKINTGNGKEKPKSNAITRIGLKLFVDQNGRNKASDWSQTKILFKNLLEVLYGDQPFYRELSSARPTFVDEIIDELVREIDAMPAELKPKKAAGLANIKLADTQLDTALYLMLRGSAYKEIVTNQQPEDGVKQGDGFVQGVDPDMTTPADQELEEADAKEHISPQGYRSLLDFVTLSSKPNIRVYLAPREVLQAIYLDPAVVEAIIQERYDLYRQADAGADVIELERKFKHNFENQRDQRIDAEALNFSVSKTRPSK